MPYQATELRAEHSFAAEIVAIAVALPTVKIALVVQVLRLELRVDERGTEPAAIVACDIMAPFLVEHAMILVAAANWASLRESLCGKLG